MRTFRLVSLVGVSLVLMSSQTSAQEIRVPPLQQFETGTSAEHQSIHTELERLVDRKAQTIRAIFQVEDMDYDVSGPAITGVHVVVSDKMDIVLKLWSPFYQEEHNHVEKEVCTATTTMAIGFVNHVAENLDARSIAVVTYWSPMNIRGETDYTDTPIAYLNTDKDLVCGDDVRSIDKSHWNGE